MMLTDDELNWIRADIEALLPDKCNILSSSGTADGYGGMTDSWGTAASNVPCRLDPIRGDLQNAGEAPQAFYRYILTLPHGTAITTQNRVDIGSTRFNVINVDLDKSWEASCRCMVERL